MNIILPKYRVSDFSNKKEGVGKKGFLIKKRWVYLMLVNVEGGFSI